MLFDNLSTSLAGTKKVISGRLPLYVDHCLLPSCVKNHSLDIEGHRPIEMIPVLLDDGDESGLAGSMILLCNAKVLFDLVLDFKNAFVPLNLKFSQPGIDLVLSHDPVAHIVHVEEVPVGLTAIPFVGTHILRDAISI